MTSARIVTLGLDPRVSIGTRSARQHPVIGSSPMMTGQAVAL